ncbi:MAG: hypothetical protein QOK30_3097 [Nocardioidaceae bacterium]|jgi:hypothetical protein|nr:hypothetical protein [Nocardioidaceae bacterium]
MRALGTLTAYLLAAVAVAAVAIGLRSVPDIRRYLKIRSM